MPKDRVCGYYVTTARYAFDDVRSIPREYPRDSERQLLVGCWRSQKQNLHVQSLRWQSGSIQLIQNRQQALNSYQEPLLLSWHRGGQQSRGRVHVSGCVAPPLPRTLPSSGFFVTLMRSLKCSSSSQDSPAGVGTQDPCSKVTPAGKVRSSWPLGVRMTREESPGVTDTSAGLLATFFLESSRCKQTQVSGNTHTRNWKLLRVMGQSVQLLNDMEKKF